MTLRSRFVRRRRDRAREIAGPSVAQPSMEPASGCVVASTAQMVPIPVGVDHELESLAEPLAALSGGRYCMVARDGVHLPAVRVLAAESVPLLPGLLADAPTTPVIVVAAATDDVRRPTGATEALGLGAAAFVDDATPAVVLAHLDAVVRRMTGSS